MSSLKTRINRIKRFLPPPKPKYLTSEQITQKLRNEYLDCLKELEERPEIGAICEGMYYVKWAKKCHEVHLRLYELDSSIPTTFKTVEECESIVDDFIQGNRDMLNWLDENEASLISDTYNWDQEVKQKGLYM